MFLHTTNSDFVLLAPGNKLARFTPLKENIDEYFQREVLPHVPDAWVDYEKTVQGYEISFTK
jgi:hypothetical protein